jgi:vancomycin resistance protein YoaR
VEHKWPDSHAEETDVLMPVTRPPAPGDEPTVRIHAEQPGEKSAGKGRQFRKIGLVAAGVFVALAVVYGVDLLLSNGEVPRGVTVAGVDVGGESQADAEQILRDKIEPRLREPVELRAGDVDLTVNPADAGLTIDWDATLAQAGTQPLNPITRLTSLFSTREVGVTTTTDDKKLAAAVEGLRPKIDREPAEGTVRFEGVTPVAVEPKAGQKLDGAGAEKALLDGWASGEKIELPVAVTKVKTTAEGVRKAVDEIAKPAVAGPVVIHGEGKDAKLEPEAIAGSLVFQPADDGGLTVTIDTNKLVGAVQPQLKSTEVEGKDAQVVFSGGAPTVEPSVDGKGVDWGKTLTPLMDVLKKTDGRELKAEYAAKPAKVTTDAANKLGIKEVVSEFTTRGFAQDSGINIRTAANAVNGTIVMPGDTFSLNETTGHRTAAKGYVDAGIISDGAPGRGIAGGVSQFATTTYNAAYFAGLKDAGHKEHSFYISRYPPGREATVFQNADGSTAIDLKFTNIMDTGIAIQTIWTPSSITVRLWGTKKYEVESIAGPRTNPTEPPTRQGPAQNCKAGNGSPGFTITDTRIVREIGTGREVSRNTRTVKYNPNPKIVCGAQPPPG